MSAYNDLMEQLRAARKENNVSYAEMGKAMNRGRVQTICLLKSNNIQLKNFIEAAKVLNLKITLTKNT